jgi:hypothetical protein
LLKQDCPQKSLPQKIASQKGKKMPIKTTLQILEEVYQFEEKILEICL